MAWCSRSGTTWLPGSSRTSAASIRACTPPIHPWKSVSITFIGIGRGRERLEHLAFENLDLLLRRLQLLLAEARQLQAALVRGEGLLERKLAAFHAGNDFFQLGESFLERKLP